MDDYRLVAARRMAWNDELWREPALIALAIRGLRDLLAESEDSVIRAEVEYLIKKLIAAGKGGSSSTKAAE